ncbi:HNH endonuclease signature motif containing protein [Streptomyces sp. JB150]|uniref:HNH endonuclease signature motif containing protein n=1 Tax=Streptomyces sp. JB150 TaxID=2714844 RepID=UPI0014095E8A|nr:HNH endonuclease signature motif containing protein [Streptomyces sp. JB150]QIJ62960.1 HNH endonuclease [Streptomyces sp. JB150]
MGDDDRYARERLAAAAAEARSWNDLMRRLELKPSGGQRRVLQEKIAAHAIDTGHFTRGPQRTYADEAIAAAAACSTTLREVALKLGAAPATGTLSHLRRRIEEAGIDISHFPGIGRSGPGFPFTDEELHTAAASADSIRGAAGALGIPDDGRSRAALGRLLRERGIDTSHFTHARLSLPDDRLRAAVSAGESYADVMRLLGLDVNHTNHRRVRRRVAQLDLDTSHFRRRSWGSPPATPRRPSAGDVLTVLPPGSARLNRDRLHAALRQRGVPCRCASCGNAGEWLGQPITLQIDHINGDWRDNRPDNLRYLCPNCHALTATWCRRKSPHTPDGRTRTLRSPSGTA